VRYLLFFLAFLAACADPGPPPPAPPVPIAAGAAVFPLPDRPVASIVSSHSGDEAARDEAGEAARTIALLPLRQGVTVADIGAGDGYFTTRLSRRLGDGGRVIATDVTPEYLGGLKQRVAAEGLANVEFVLGGFDDPRLPAASVDVALMVRMYHEIEQPYAFLWHLRAALKPGGVVAVSERDRETENHGIRPALLRCEFEAVGYEQTGFEDLGPGNGYLALFAPSGELPEPDEIRPCAG
jgi:predicted methyltransferase